MKLALIRHFKTPGNLEHRYIGRTDEHLAPAEDTPKMCYPDAEVLVSSSMLRCKESAKRIYGRWPDLVEETLKEKDFGAYEGKNHQELKEEKAYCKWLESGGALPFPEGESMEAFCRRVRSGFDRCVLKLMEQKVKTAAFLVHGGTIMAIFSAYAEEPGQFYDWQVENGNGYQASLRESDWFLGRKKLVEIHKLW